MDVGQALFKHKTLKELPKCRRGEVLCALEEFIGPEVQARTQGLEQLLALNAHRRSPLVAAVFASRVVEPNLDLRVEIIKALAEALAPAVSEKKPPESVRCWLRCSIGQMRRREVYALLQVVAASPDHIEQVCHILNASSFSGEALARILNDRSMDVTIRVAAAEAIGRVGFLEAEPILQKLEQRLASRRDGQLEMDFVPSLEQESEALLPAVLNALHALGSGAD